MICFSFICSLGRQLIFPPKQKREHQEREKGDKERAQKNKKHRDILKVGSMNWEKVTQTKSDKKTGKAAAEFQHRRTRDSRAAAAPHQEIKSASNDHHFPRF